MESEVVYVNKENVHEHSQILSNIYRKGYFYNEQTKKSFYPLDWVNHSKSIENIITKELAEWMYVKQNNKPTFATIGVYEDNDVETMAAVSIPCSRNQGNYSNLFVNNVNNFIYHFLSNPKYEKVIADVQLTAKSILFNVILAGGVPVGFSPNMRKINNSKGLKRMSTYNTIYYPNYFYKKPNIFNNVLEKRIITTIIPEISDLSQLVCENMNIETPKISNIKIHENNSKVLFSKETKFDHLFVDSVQSVNSEGNSFNIYTNHPDKSAVLSDFKISDYSVLKNMIRKITEKNVEVISVSGIKNIETQRVLYDNGFIPVSFIPAGKLNQDVISMNLIKNFDSYDYKKITELNKKNIEFIKNNYNFSNNIYNGLKTQFNISKIIINNILNTKTF